MVASKKAGTRNARKVTAIERVARAKKATALARKKGRAESLLALIERRKKRIVEDFYDIGEALRALLREKLYEALGFGSFGDLLDARALMGRSQAMKLIAVVDQIPRDHALELGAEKSYALVSYAAATPEADSPVSLVAQDARVGGKPVSRASTREVTAAARAQRAKVRAAAPETHAQREARTQAATVERAVRARLRAAGIARAGVEVRDDVVVVTLSRALADRLARE